MTLLMSLGELSSALSVTEYEGENFAGHVVDGTFVRTFESGAFMVGKVIIRNLSSKLGLEFGREGFDSQITLRN
jgi:hypothetical protein